MAFVATFLLLIVLVIRPQEIWPALGALRLLDVLTMLSALGVVIDFARRRNRNAYTPQLPFLLAFLLAAYFTTALAIGMPAFSLVTSRVAFGLIFMAAVAYGARSTPAQLTRLYGLLLGMAIFVAAVAVHQGRQGPECIEAPPEVVDIREDGTPTGRECEYRSDCAHGGAGDVDYECERVGMFGTTSVERRVRWRGQLGDPNELAVYLGAVIPFIFPVTARWKKGIRVPAILAMVALLLYAVILTQSRGGQLVVGVVAVSLGITRFGWKKGILGAAALALPVILLGGRSGDAADASADERLEILYDAITDFTRHPLFGQGMDQFTEEHHLTAHNSYVLAVVDLGFPGFFAWMGILYATIKIPWVVVRRTPAGLDPHVRDLAFATLVSFAGMLVGIFFLSFTYKQLLFVWAGAGGAIYGAVRNECPDFEVKIGFKDLLLVFALSLGLLVVILLYTRLH